MPTKPSGRKQRTSSILVTTSMEQKPPEVAFPLDEAIASQLPFIFSEIEAMHGIGENYIELVGKKRQRREQVTTVRALNIDIGGGTTDYAIVEYSDTLSGSGVELESTVLFKDSTNIAGDEVVKAIIERIVLPAFGMHLEEEGEEYLEAYSAFFRVSLSERHRCQRGMEAGHARVFRPDGGSLHKVSQLKGELVGYSLLWMTVPSRHMEFKISPRVPKRFLRVKDLTESLCRSVSRSRRSPVSSSRPRLRRSRSRISSARSCRQSFRGWPTSFLPSTSTS